LQVVREFFVFGYLFFKVGFGLLQFVEFTSSLHLGKHVIAVKKQHPNYKSGCCEQKFIPEK
jgi:hypothetical protein